MTYTNLTINILQEDVGLLYLVLGQYHQDRDRFRKVQSKYLKGDDEINDVPERIDNKETFYDHIIKTCECGNCFNNFARPTRTPWIWQKPYTYVNAEYGTLTINCKVGETRISGYIYQKFGVLKERVQVEEAQVKLQTLRAKSIEIQESAKEKVVKTQLEALKLQNRIREDEGKQRTELEEAENQLVKIEMKHQNAYENHLKTLTPQKVFKSHFKHIHEADPESCDFEYATYAVKQQVTAKIKQLKKQPFKNPHEYQRSVARKRVEQLRADMRSMKSTIVGTRADLMAVPPETMDGKVDRFRKAVSK
jgi:hypothetical protein